MAAPPGAGTLGFAPEQVKPRMDKWTSPTSKKGTLTLLDEGLRQVFGRSLRTENSELWAKVNEARDPRKNVVHPWPKRPNADETLRAMIAIEEAPSWLSGPKTSSASGGYSPS